VRKTINPDDAESTLDEEAEIDAAVSGLREREGLQDADKMLSNGFVSRGKPLKAIESLRKSLAAKRDAAAANATATEWW